VEDTTIVGSVETAQTTLDTAVAAEIDSDNNVADLLAAANNAADVANDAIAAAQDAADTLAANENPTAADIATAQNAIDAAEAAIETAADAASSYESAATTAGEEVEDTTIVGSVETAQTTLDTAVAAEIEDTVISADIDDTSDTGISSEDNVTNDNTPTISGNAEVGAVVVITTGLGDVIGTAVTDENGDYSITTDPLTDGSHNLTITVTDSLGNSASTTQDITIDTTLSDTSSLAITDISDNSGDYSTITMSGTGAEVGNTITIYDESDNAVATAIVDEDGNWNADISNLSATPVNDNEFFKVTETDIAGNETGEVDSTHFWHGSWSGIATDDTDDFVMMGSGDDTLHIDDNDLNDTLVADGGAGNDTVVFDGNSSDYTITKNDDGTVIVTENVSTDSDGDAIGDVSELRNVETISFADGTYDVGSGELSQTITINKDNVDDAESGFSISAFDAYGNEASISSNSYGFGVTGNASGANAELGYKDGVGSEKLVVDFDNDVSSVDVSFGWKNSSEDAEITFFKDGVEVGSTINHGGTDRIDAAVTLQPDNGESFDQVVFSAPDGGNHDYMINSISFEQVEILGNIDSDSVASAPILEMSIGDVNIVENQENAQEPLAPNLEGADIQDDGSSRWDSVNGSRGDDTIIAGDDYDTVSLYGGNDNLSIGDGDSGWSTISASSGDKTIAAGNDWESITTGSGDDNISVGEDSVNISTGYGEDNISAGNTSSTDFATLDAGGDNDNVTVGDNWNEIKLGSGDDTLNAGDGATNVNLGTGNDTATIGNAGEGYASITGTNGNNTVTAGNDWDKVLMGSGDDNVELQDGLTNGVLGSGDDTLVAGDAGDGFAYVDSGSGNDNVTLGDGFDNVWLGSGDDTLNVGKSDDGWTSISAGEGNDNITVDSGWTTINGGAGEDTVTFKGDASDWEVGERWGHTIVTNKGTGDITQVDNVENIRFGGEDAQIASDISYEYPITFSASLADTDGSETLSSITVSNIPDGATLVGLTPNEDGSYTVDIDENGEASVTLSSEIEIDTASLNTIQASVTSTETTSGNTNTTQTTINGVDDVATDESNNEQDSEETDDEDMLTNLDADYDQHLDFSSLLNGMDEGSDDRSSADSDAENSFDLGSIVDSRDIDNDIFAHIDQEENSREDNHDEHTEEEGEHSDTSEWSLGDFKTEKEYESEHSNRGDNERDGRSDDSSGLVDINTEIHVDHS
uniref:Ig-like domain-containing protein n=2 Tax=Sulfurimonas sp. TaxID=2022749 RepID=UPI003D11E573